VRKEERLVKYKEVVAVMIQIPQSWNKNRTLNWVITRELNRVPSTNYSTLYTTDHSLCTHYPILP